jgi:hypothetical protein
MVRWALPQGGRRFLSKFKSLFVCSSSGTSKGIPAIDNIVWLSGKAIFLLCAMNSKKVSIRYIATGLQRTVREVPIEFHSKVFVDCPRSS